MLRLFSCYEGIATGLSLGTLVLDLLSSFSLLAEGLTQFDVDLTPFLERIENKKEVVSISITDEESVPLEGIKIMVRQTSQEFLFGNVPEYLLFAYAPEYYRRGRRFGTSPLEPEKLDQYKSLYLELFNYATVPAFYWADYEPRPGKLPLVGAAKKIARWLNENGISIKGHALVWGIPPGVGVPGWVWAKGLRGDWEEVREALFGRLEREVREFKEVIDMWDVVNEPIVQPWFDNLGPDYIADAFRLVKELDPDAVLILNEYGMLVDDEIRHRFIARAQALLEAGVPIDVIGVEAHIFTGQDITSQLLALDKIYAALDELAALGKPIHITEFQIPLPAVMEAFGASTEDAEVLQAEIARIFYTVFFSHPAVEAITYWNFYRAWQPGSGLLRDDLTPKPLYFELQRLIHEEWKTTVQGWTDEEGKFCFRGFPGLYEITVQFPDGETEEFRIQVVRGAANRFSLRVSGGSQ